MAAVALLAHWGDHMDGWDAEGWAMMLGMIIFWALVIVAIVWLVRAAPWDTGPRRSAQEGPLELLDRRFAAGEISAEEYRERRAVLRGESDRPG